MANAFLSYGSIRTSLITSCVVALFLVWVMRSVADTQLLIGWLAALYVTNTVRFFHARHALAREDTETKDLNWFTFGVLVSGIVWGSSAILFSSPDAPHHQVFLAFALGGMVAGSVGGYAAWPPAFYAFAVPSLAPITILNFLGDSETATFMGVLLFIFGGALAVLTHNVNKIIAQTVELRDALKESEEESYGKMARAVEQASELIVLFDPNDRIVFGNRAWREFNTVVEDASKPGTKYEEHIRALVEGGFIPEAIGQEEQWIANRLEKHQNPQGPFEVSRQDGKWIWIHEQRLDDGSLMTVVSDITEQKRVESELRLAKDAAEAAEELFSKAYHSSPALFTISTPETGQYIDINDAWTTVTGYGREETLTSNTFDLNIWANPEDRTEFVQRITDNGIVQNFETQCRTKSGKTIDILLSGELIEYRGQDCLLMVGQDISKMKELDRIKNEFISTASHELRTPLTSIRGSLGLVAGGVTGEIPDQAKNLVDIAAKNCERLLLLVNDILDMERIESGNMSYRSEPIELNELVAQTIEANQGYADEHHVTFVQHRSQKDALVRGDPERLAQVLSNLLSNAAKFAPTQSEIIISTTADTDTCRVSVTDKGPGISAEFRAQIFEKFTQEDASDDRQVGGTGLGLSISKAIIDGHDGVLDFVSEVGNGTEFYFNLPRHNNAD